MIPTTAAAVQSVLTDHGIDWQPQPLPYLTRKGKTKPVLCGLPSSLFWRHYKRQPELRALLRLAGAWLRRLDKAQWEVLLPINRQTLQPVAAALDLDPVALTLATETPEPVACALAAEPAGPDPF